MSLFDGMTDRESVLYQLEQWVSGNPLHNAIRDECCPDFSCCNNKNMMPVAVRKQFSESFKKGDESLQFDILSMGFQMLTSEIDVNIHIAGNDSVEH